MKEPAFAAAYRDAKRAAFGQSIARLHHLSSDAVSTLGKIMLDATAPPATRVRASDSILNHTAKAIEIEDIEARVSELERAANLTDRGVVNESDHAQVGSSDEQVCCNHFGPTAAESIMESRRRRLEASGQRFVPRPVDCAGCRTVADRNKGIANLNLKARLKTLERHQLPVFKEPFRLVVSHIGEPLDLSKATCTRTIFPNRQLFELVNLNATDDRLSKDDLESFIQSSPGN